MYFKIKMRIWLNEHGIEFIETIEIITKDSSKLVWS